MGTQESAMNQPTCDECGKSKADGWALYCVSCVEPMFASPQRKPLSEEEIFAIENDIPDAVVSDRAWTIFFARAIERAHGIGGNDDNANP